MPYHIRRQQVEDPFRNQFMDFPNKEFQNLTRSTIPLLAFWSDINNREIILEDLRIEIIPQNTTFEYPVSPKCNGCASNGRGASYTDMMLEFSALNGDVPEWVVAIEAKYTERVDVSVGEKLHWAEQNDRIVNWSNRIRHWWHLVSQQQAPPPPEVIEGRNAVAYQMLHRTASACYINAQRVIVLHLLFVCYEDGPAANEHKIQEYINALQVLANAIPVHDFVPELALITVMTTRTRRWAELTAQLVGLTTIEKAALIRGSITAQEPLFNFTDRQILWITRENP